VATGQSHHGEVSANAAEGAKRTAEGNRENWP
jgi:hypothetical protein